ncbi:MAG: hypothetical protein GEU88_19485 [Solirubrobacterales bacterium]|nr:hypothetical protein [Solirubrobacterales bacterium]
MQSRRIAPIVAVVGVVVAVVLFVVLRGGDDDSGSETSAATETTASPAADDASGEGGSGPAGGAGNAAGSGGDDEGAGGASEGSGGGKSGVPTIVVEGGQPVGGVQDLTFSKGDDIRFIVKSDVADHVHLHGYDVMEDVPAGGQVEFDVPATIDGVFEVELEDRVVPLAEITVQP